MLLPSTAESYLEEQISKAKDMQTVKNIVFAGLLLLVAGVISQLVYDLLSPESYIENPYIALVFEFFNYALFFYVTSYLLYFVARVLGGKGTFKQQIYLQSVVAVALSFLQALFVVLTSFILSDNITLLLVASSPILVIGLYTIYMDYKIIKTVHKLTSARSAMSIAGFWLLIIAIFMLMYLGIYLLTGQVA
jgi:xanthosine utilization system XapX-like protein